MSYLYTWLSGRIALQTTAVLTAVCSLCGCQHAERIVPVPVVVEPVAGITVAFDSFVNVNYAKNRSLHGWQTTRTVIATTLDLWYGQVQIRQGVTDGTPADLQAFLRNLPGPDECDISVVYLGSIQDASGSWEFTGGQRVNWRHLAAAAVRPHPNRIVILDACHAAVVGDIPGWTGLATITLLASDRTEKTYQFSPSAFLPIDVSKHYPAVEVWGQAYLTPEWKKHISYLGLIWMQTVANRNTPPKNIEQWSQFLNDCVRNAADFRQYISRRWGSTLQKF